MTKSRSRQNDAENSLTLAGLLFESAQGLGALLEQDLRKHSQLSVQWFEVLLRLKRTPGGRLRMADLSLQTTLTRSGLTRAVDRLEETGFVRRVVCESDGRGAYCEITAAGAKELEKALPSHLCVLKSEFIGMLSRPEQERLAHLLRKVRDHVKPQHLDSIESRRAQ